MKKLFQVILLQLLCVLSTSAQWDTSNSPTIYYNAGNVGIGTSSPELAGHLLGATGFPAASGTAQIGILRLQGSGSNGVLDFSVNAGSGASLQVANRSDLSLKYPLLFNPNGGNVGIGTTTPSFKLDVEGPGVRIKNSSTSSYSYTTFRLQGPDYAEGLEIDMFGNNNIGSDLNWSYGGGAGSAAIINVNAKPLTFGTSNIGRMLIDAAGNVGIGTTNPGSYKLAVAGKNCRK